MKDKTTIWIRKGSGSPVLKFIAICSIIIIASAPIVSFISYEALLGELACNILFQKKLSNLAEDTGSRKTLFFKIKNTSIIANVPFVSGSTWCIDEYGQIYNKLTSNEMSCLLI